MVDSDKRVTPLDAITEIDIETKLSEDYGLVPKNIEKFTGGTESIAWRIKTDTGNFVAKVFGAKADTFERVKEETSLYDFLHAQAKKYDIEAPLVISDKKNQSVSLLVNHPFMVMRYENMRRLHPSSITLKEMSKLSVAVAHLHQLLRGYKEEHSTEPIYLRWNLDYNQSAYEVLEQSPNKAMYSNNEMKDFQKVSEDVVSFLEKTPFPENLTQSYLHGDIGLEHIQLLPNGNLYVFDWADRVRGPVARELSILLFHSYREEDISFQRWKQLRGWILESYSQVNELKKVDIDAVVPFIFRRYLDEVRYLSDLGIGSRLPVEVHGIARRFDLAKKLIESVS